VVHHKFKDDNKSNTKDLLNRIKEFMSPARNSLPVMTLNAASNQTSLFQRLTLSQYGVSRYFRTVAKRP